MSAAPLLRTAGVTGGYGPVDILHGIDLQVGAREIVAIIGPNGAGKSTLLKTVFGLARLSGGKVFLGAEDISGWAPARIARRGLGYVPQVANVFAEMTVQENLEIGAFLRRDGLATAMERVFGLFPDLTAKRHKPAGSLSGGQRQMVAFGRALMLDPQVLLLDEPTAGLSPKYQTQIFQIVRDIRAAGVAVLLVEQHAKQALALCDRAYVLAAGCKRAEGRGRDLLADADIGRLFLGS
ncbi:ABC transporter ATP-binding protein [Pelagibius marinus]|uniref:ABC transporter ATP-binding protein n=1 Tax=Pelagibius marinus TaxID=2762760 RepID=UPI0029CA19C1|nr:ABC transporter ATP-binding protein [Pelagibius marinus]